MAQPALPPPVAVAPQATPVACSRCFKVLPDRLLGLALALSLRRRALPRLALARQLPPGVRPVLAWLLSAPAAAALLACSLALLPRPAPLAPASWHCWVPSVPRRARRLHRKADCRLVVSWDAPAGWSAVSPRLVSEPPRSADRPRCVGRPDFPVCA